MNFLKNKKGITLTILVITIIVLTIIVSIIVINTRTSSDQRALNNMYNDIRIMDGKISLYYEKYGELPVLKNNSGEKITISSEEVHNKIDAANSAFTTNPNDSNYYYVIDKSKLDNMSLAYPEKTYIINQASHTIYFISDYDYSEDATNQEIAGIEIDDEIYYRLPINYEEVSGIETYNVNYVPGLHANEDKFGIERNRYRNLQYGEEMPSFVGELESVDSEFVFGYWRCQENGKTFVDKDKIIEEYPTVKDSWNIEGTTMNFEAQWVSIDQTFEYEFFDTQLNNEWNSSSTIVHQYLLTGSDDTKVYIDSLPNNVYYKSKYLDTDEDLPGNIDYRLNRSTSNKGQYYDSETIEGVEYYYYIENADEFHFAGWYFDKEYTDPVPYDSENNKYYITGKRGALPENKVYAKWIAPAAKINHGNTDVVYDFENIGSYEEFVAPVTGDYKIQAWGANGGDSLANASYGASGGFGGYTEGTISLNRGDTLYIYVGGKGANGVIKENATGGYNGGGLGTSDDYYGNGNNNSAGAGGGASDIRLEKGTWDDFDSLKSRIMVAGGGAGASSSTAGGNGGGLSGTTNRSRAVAGNQTSGYAFGKGENGYGVRRQ